MQLPTNESLHPVPRYKVKRRAADLTKAAKRPLSCAFARVH
jgi:hypothetical protein